MRRQRDRAASGRFRGFAVAAAVAVITLLAPAAPVEADVARIVAGQSARPAAAGRSHPPVLPATGVPETAPRRDNVARALAGAIRARGFGPAYGLYVYDLSRKREVYAHHADRAYIPASSLKLLTGAAALQLLGPDHRFTTKVVDAPGGITLVGGGDPLLATGSGNGYPQPATIQQLASTTAAKLRARGRMSVRLNYDDSLFAGPAVNPAWRSVYIASGEVSPTSALWVDEGRTRAGGTGTPRHAAPARAAVTAFADALAARGIRVASTHARVRSETSARVVAAVRSPMLVSIVERMISRSDNDIAEVLARHASLAAGGNGSISHAVTTVHATVATLGVAMTGARITDGSGLSRSTVVPLQALAGVVAAAADPVRHPRLAGVLSGLPVAGFNGTLTTRFSSAGAVAGEGYVRAKTGTLTGVHTLTGIVRDRRGTLFAFAEAADRVPEDLTFEARDALTVVATGLYRCGC